MASTKTRLLLTACAGLAVAGGLWLGLGEPGAERDAGGPPDPAPVAAAGDGPLPAPSAASGDDALAALLGDTAVQGYQARLRFAADYRGFIAGASELDEAERRRRAAALAREIDRREAAGELALSEALLLQIGLAQAEGGDEAAQKARADALVARYQALSRSREEKARAPDARFSQYKSEEKRIVEEVMALDSIPDGLSRDQYLRQRLQEAREQAYQ